MIGEDGNNRPLLFSTFNNPTSILLSGDWTVLQNAPEIRETSVSLFLRNQGFFAYLSRF